MKCWVCKKIINRATRVNYCDGIKAKTRDVCEDCYPRLKFNECRFVVVKKI